VITYETKQNFAAIGKRLRCIREHLSLTRLQIQNKYGLSAETLKSWESGKIGLTAKGLDRCLEIYRIEKIVLSREWVITGNGLDPRLSAEIARIPIESKGKPASGTLGDFDLALKEVTFFRELSPEAVVMQISDNDMQPFYSPGDYVGGRYEVGLENWNESLGKDCIVLAESGEVYIRRLAKNNKNEFVLTLHNPHWGGAYEPVIVGLKIAKIAPIIWHRRLKS
jgi:phage repressor protein C with HTH and peptisase S24 domain